MESKIIYIQLKNYLKECQVFKQILSEKISLIKKNNKNIDLSNIIKDDKNLTISFIFFSHIKKNFYDKYISKYTHQKSIQEDINDNIVLNYPGFFIKDYKYNLLYYWQHYLIISLVKEIELYLKERGANDKQYNTLNINRVMHMFEKNKDFIILLYKNNQINIKEILLLLDIYLIWIEENNNKIKENISYDQYHKLKNYFLLKVFFNLLKILFQIELDNKTQNESLNDLFKYLDKLSNINIYSVNNNLGIIKNKEFSSLSKLLYENINMNIYNKYKMIILNFSKDYIKNNFNESKFVAKMINNIKNSFLDLNEIDLGQNINSKILIEKYLISQNIYFELLYSSYNNLLTSLNNIKFFNYNGIDSKMSIRIKKAPLINTIIIFSFCIKTGNLNNDKKIYPLIAINDESKNTIIFKLYIIKKPKGNKFNLYIQEQEKKKQINDLSYIDNDKTYYMALSFEEKSILIYLNENLQEIKIKKSYKNEDNVIQIGYDKISQDYFKGIIGPLFLLKNNVPPKKKSKIIVTILKMKEIYPYFIFSIGNDSIYNFDYMDNFRYNYNVNKEQIDINNLYNNTNDFKINFECLLYLTPFILEYIKKESSDKIFLPPIPNICDRQNNYNIYELNVSLVKYENIPINFLMSNGLYIICLQYEYLYQLSIILIKNNTNMSISIDNEIKDIIIHILNNTLEILSHYSNQILNYYGLYKMIFLNLFNCIKNYSQINIKIINDSSIKNLGNILLLIIDNINNKKENKLANNNNDNANEDDIKKLSDNKKLIIFRDGLIDLLLTSEIYDKDKLGMIQYTFELLLSLNNKNSDNIFISNKNLLWKILSFVQLLESLFNDKNEIKDEKNKNNENIINQKDITNVPFDIFNLLKNYFIGIKSEPDSQALFHNLFHFIMSNNKNHLIYNYLDLIHELITKEYYLGNNEIYILINYSKELINPKNKNETTIDIDNTKIEEKKDNNNIIKDNNEKIQEKMKEKIISVILCILIDLIYGNLTHKEIKNDMLNLIDSIDITNEMLDNICKEIDKLFNFIFNKNFIDYKDDFKLYIDIRKKIKLSKAYSRIFGLLYKLLNTIIVHKNERNPKNEMINKVSLINIILSFLININKVINEDYNKEKKVEHISLILVNYVKFLHKIIFNNLLDHFSAIELDMFIFTLSDVANLCKKELFLHSNALIKMKINEQYYQKSFLEILLDIYINILFNDKYEKSFNFITNSFSSIFDNVEIKNKKYTIFYYNDYLINLFSKWKLDKNNQKFRDRINNINDTLFKQKRINAKFKVSFTTFSLLKIASYLQNIQEDTKIKNNESLKTFLETYIEKLLEEHKDLYKLNKSLFSKVSNNLYYNHLKNKLETYITSNAKNKENKKFGILLEFKEFFEQKLSNFYNQISFEITSGNCNTKGNKEKTNKNKDLDDDDNRSIMDHRRSVGIKRYFPKLHFTGKQKKNYLSHSFKEENNNYNMDNSLQYSTTTNLDNFGFLENKNNNNDIDDINDLNLPDLNTYSNIVINIGDDLPEKKVMNLQEINLSDYINTIYYFEDIDNNYIINIKKYLMNNIFSRYFLNTFFNNKLFERMKFYYLNHFENIYTDTKKMNYPSKYKNYNNGLDIGMFLKQYNNFFVDKYFPISHPYFLNYIKTNNIHPKSIKLYQKELPNYLKKNVPNKFIINAELISINHFYFGEIFGYNSDNENKYLIFNEKKFKLECSNENILDDKEYYQFLFSMSCLAYLEEKNKKEINKKKNNEQNITKTRKRNNKIIIILFSEIEEIIERRFLLMWQGVEIFLKNGKSYFFNLFSEKGKNNILDIFKADEKLKNLIHTKEFLTTEKEITQKWINNHISTYEYLLLVNKYSSRSLNDNSQYYIFPWLVTKDCNKIEEINENDNIIEEIFLKKTTNQNVNKKIKSLLKIIRKMRYPICIQNEEKIQSVIDKYIEDDEKFKYHLGIHYSTSSYIYYYLMRQQPYSNLMIKLQNYQQENPNRMFTGISEALSILENGKDPREIIPELYSRIEYLINLNCDYFGIKSNKKMVDDIPINFFKVNENTNPFFKYIKFIIEHRKLLNSKCISLIINEWIDSIFGINQLPKKQKDKENCCNIYMKTCYEQEFNLLEKLNKYLDKIKDYEKDENNNPTGLFKLKKKYIKKLSTKINSIINFGQTPYQVFKEKHFKKELNEINEDNDIENEQENNNGDMLNKLYKIITTQNLSNEMKNKDNYLYFEINLVLNKIFVLSEKRILEINHTNLFSKEGANKYSLSFHDSIQLPHILYNDKIKNEFGEDYYIYKIKYALSSFDDIEEDNNYNNINTKDLFHTYGRDIIENIIINKEKDKNIDKNKKNENNENSYYKFITCRYIDKSFKIHRYLKDKNSKNNKNKNMDIYRPFSFICEDYVCSCCTISFCQFLIGLKNGKLIQFYIEQEKLENNNVKSKENMGLFQIKMEKYIQAHKGKINLIEINKRLGLIITGGDDNYILIRKLYDFELLSPIKIKKKYIITMAKISPLNFIYVLCYHKEKKKSVIFGYTLTGLKFAKSNYGFYDNIDFTMSGNIVTLNNNNELFILSGSKLAYLKMNLYDKDFDDYNIINDKIQNSIWLTFNYFRRESDTQSNYNKIITYYKKGDNKLATINVSGNKYFD